MSIARRIEGLLTRFALAGAVLYAALIVAFISMTAATVLDIVDRREAAMEAASILEQIEARGSPRSRSEAATDIAIPAGSPFLEGPSASVASAALLQRVTAATTRVGGTVQSSQVDQQGPQTKPGFVSVTASLEVDAAALQPLLYDLEAGMPFLYVDQTVVQSASGPTKAANNDKTGDKMRVLLSLSGQWRGAK